MLTLHLFILHCPLNQMPDETQSFSLLEHLRWTDPLFSVWHTHSVGLQCKCRRETGSVCVCVCACDHSTCMSRCLSITNQPRHLQLLPWQPISQSAAFPTALRVWVDEVTEGLYIQFMMLLGNAAVISFSWFSGLYSSLHSMSGTY